MPTEMIKYKCHKTNARMFLASLYHNSSRLEIMQKSINRINKLWYIQTMGYNKAIKKNELELHATHESHCIK